MSHKLITLSLCLQFVSVFTIVRFGSNTTAYNEFAWIILEGVEGYDFIRKHLAGVWASLTDLEKDSIRLGQRVLKIRFSLVADYKMGE